MHFVIKASKFACTFHLDQSLVLDVEASNYLTWGGPAANVPSNFFKECAQKYIHVQILHFFQKYVRSHASGRADYVIHCTTSFPTIKLHEKTSSYKIYMHYMCS